MSVSRELSRSGDDWAFFLDVDGTLADIAAAPEVVVVSPPTISLLRDLALRLCGAVALVSGRSLADLDRLFAPLRLPAAGLHGLERRTAAGRTVRAAVPARALAAARADLQPLARLPGVFVEDKGAALAVHYRHAPERAAEVVRTVRDLARRSNGALIPLAGKMVAELRAPGPHKGDVVDAFLAEAPFAGRIPVFIGDDATDEDGFRAASRRGGFGIRVGEPAPSAARHRAGSVAELHEWLRGLAATAEAPP